MKWYREWGSEQTWMDMLGEETWRDWPAWMSMKEPSKVWWWWILPKKRETAAPVVLTQFTLLHLDALLVKVQMQSKNPIIVWKHALMTNKVHFYIFMAVVNTYSILERGQNIGWPIRVSSGMTGQWQHCVAAERTGALCKIVSHESENSSTQKDSRFYWFSYVDLEFWYLKTQTAKISKCDRSNWVISVTGLGLRQ